MTHRVFVDGQEGTTGLRIHELLASRRELDVLNIAPDKRKDPHERARLLNSADVAFLCLPDAAAREAVALVENPATCVIDASTAHRISPDWVYGLPELAPEQRQRLRRAKRIANPGCHATAFILVLKPLIDAGLVAPNLALSATSITGYSGGGRKMIAQYETGGDPTLLAPRPYALSLEHKHVPEMMAHTGLTTRPLFMPIVANFYKGLAVSVPLHLSQLAAGVDASALHGALVRRYADEPYVRVLPLDITLSAPDGYLDVQACNDSNRCEILVFAGAGQVIVVARLDNLGKGASGAAVQAMNLHLGLNESAGLD